MEQCCETRWRKNVARITGNKVSCWYTFSRFYKKLSLKTLMQILCYRCKLGNSRMSLIPHRSARKQISDDTLLFKIREVVFFMMSVVLCYSFCPWRDRAKCWSLGWLLLPTLQHKIIPAAKRKHDHSKSQIIFEFTIEQFSFECRITKTKVIQSNTQSAGKRVWVSQNWFWFYLWLEEKVARIFWDNRVA